MIPSVKDWKVWSPGAKATYLAQILAPFSLLITVVFAYLSWSEAREATSLQREMFAAQNSPYVELEAAQVVAYGYPNKVPAIELLFKNTGDSIAKSICAEIGQNPNKPLQRICDPDHYEGKTAIPKGRNFTYLFILTKDLMRNLDDPERVEVMSPGKNFKKCAFYGIELFITVDFADHWGKKNRTVREIIICDDNPVRGAVTK